MPLKYPAYLVVKPPLSLLPPTDYLIYDLFSDDHAAGAGDGLPSAPGPGIRQDVDTENKISQTGGEMVISAGKATPAWGDPGRWWEDNEGNALARLAGRTLGMILESSDWDNFEAGWSASQSGEVNESAFTIGGGRALVPLDNAVLLATIFTLANDAEYKFYLMLRSSGNYLFGSGR